MKTLHSDPSKVWTLKEFLLLEETNRPCELINGELIMSPTRSPNHQEISGLLYILFTSAASVAGGKVYYSPIGLFINQHNLFEPDILYLSPKKLSFITRRGIEGPPDLVVEILSPFNSRTDKGIKKKTYLEFGVGEYWIVDPFEKNITVYTPSSGKDVPLRTFTGKDKVSTLMLPTLTFDLDKIFPI